MANPPKIEALGGQIEKESCIHLKHKKCWDPTSKLSTSKELGVGFGQITKAYTKTGAVRFDALAELRSKHPAHLSELTWGTIQSRPDLQIRAIILKMRDNYERYKNTEDPYTFALVSYNGGTGGLDKERRACKLSSTCNPNIWYANVERFCLKSRKVLYSVDSPCDINRKYPREIQERSTKYIPYITVFRNALILQNVK